MNRYLLPLTLPILLAACGTQATVPAQIFNATSLDAHVDLTRGPNPKAGWTAAGETVVLYKNGIEGANAKILAQGTLGADGHARLNLPTPDASLLTTTSNAQEGLFPDGCTIASVSATPSSFSSLVGSLAIKTALSTQGALRLTEDSAVTADLRSLTYADRKVDVTAQADCVAPGRTDRIIYNVHLNTGWNLIAETTTQSGTTYTHTLSTVSLTSSALSLDLIGGTELSLP